MGAMTGLTTMGEAMTVARTGPAAIEIEGLTVAYGKRRAVDRLSFVVPTGSIFGFLGPNGAGKTSTIKTLLGFRTPDAGRARVLGHDVAREGRAVRARVGYASEVNSLYDALTIPQLCAFCRETNPRWRQALVDRYLALFELPPRGKVGGLSKGMKSQLALSLALGGEPDLLILDEPTSGLDPVARHQFLNVLIGDVAAEGKTVFFSTHILADIEAVADRVAIIHRGRLAVCEEIDRLRETHKVLKLGYADPPPVDEIAEIAALPGVARVDREGRSVRLQVRGDVSLLDDLVRRRPYPPRDVEVLNRTLEDIFLGYMLEAKAKEGRG